MFIFSKKDLFIITLFYLSGRVTEGGRNGHSGWGWAEPKPGVWNSTGVFPVGSGARGFRPCKAAFPGTLAGSWIGSGAAGTAMGSRIARLQVIA